MKTNRLVMGCVLVLLGSTSLSLRGQTEDTPYTVVENGANYRVWQRTTMEYSVTGDIVPKKHRYAELATGLNYKDAQGQWVEAKEVIQPWAAGGAAAVQGQHQVYFPYNLYQGTIEIVTPERKQLRSRPLGLSYDDGARTVLIGELKGSVGQLVSSNQVIYPDAFKDIRADVRYTYTKAGIEQDIVLREQLPGPEAYGLAANARLQVLTEFFDSPEPRSVVHPSRGNQGRNDRQGGAEDLADTTLDFGGMQMGPGQAFSVEDSLRVEISRGSGNRSGRGRGGHPVYKTWAHLEGRTFLIEELPFQSIQPELENLPQPGGQSRLNNASRPKAMARRVLPASRPVVEAMTKALPLAASGLNRQAGLVMDYNLINTDQANVVFQGDTTYYISGYCILSGNTTIEGGTVIKFAVNSGISLYGTALCQTASYRPAVFTAVDDDSVGETIAGSTGNPTNYYGALNLNGSVNLSCFRMSYLNGIQVSAGDKSVFGDAQFINCQYVAEASLVDCTLRNVLVQGANTVIYCSSGTLVGENVTIHQAQKLALVTGGSATCYLTNCLVVAVANTNTPTIYGKNNAFLGSDAGVFQTVGGGANYLTNNTYRNLGTTNINPTLLAELRQKTTHAPQWYADAWIDSNTTLGPVVSRDTNAANVDLGYHYDALDYYYDGYSILFTGTLILTNGVQVAFGGPFYIEPTATLVSQGKADRFNRLVQCRTVQEQATNWASDPTLSSDAVYNSITVNCRFTEFSRLAGPGGHVSDDYKGGAWNFRDCQFRGSQVSFVGQSFALNVGLTNCLFERTKLFAGGTNLTLRTYNDLFYQGDVWLSSSNTLNSFTFRDNLFYRNNLTNRLVICGSLVYDHNGYITNFTTLGSGTGDVIVPTNFTFQSSWLGNYYQPPNSPLIDAGSRNATNAGLYHYTVTTNQVKEAATPVDIGYHYVAVDTNGSPIDSNGDGIPDYIADKNGNGIKDTGESPWGIVAVNDNAQTYGLQPVTIPVLANDSDQNGGTLSISGFMQGANGSVAFSADHQTLIYTPGIVPMNVTPSPAGQQFSVSSVNVQGLACGSLVVANGNTHAALWQVGGAITDLDPTGTYSVAETINDSGTVVGYMTVAGGASHAFKYSQGVMTDLHSQVAGAGFPNSIAWGINNQGQICGQLYATTPVVTNQAFFMDNNSSVTHLASFGGYFIAAYGLNDSGVVVGQSDTSSAFHAFKWRPGAAQATDLNPYFSIPNQWAIAINTQGDIAGYTALYYNYWAYVIQNGVFRDLSSGYGVSWVNALNSKGQIVGSYYSGSDHALYWQGSQHYDLSTLLPAGSGWVFNDAVSINENGLIVGNGTYQGQSRAFATTAPVPYTGPDTFTYTISDGSATAGATVYVNVNTNPIAPPLITQGPTNQITVQGQNILFSVNATGSGPLYYQWIFDGNNISGATNSTLLLTNVSPSNMGGYVVVVTNSSGSVSSSTAILTVVSVASLSPINNANCTLVGSNATLQTWTIPASTTTTNLEILAIPAPNLPVSSLPTGWSLDGIKTNIEYISITNAGVHTVVCSAGTSIVTNIILVSTGTNYPVATVLPGILINLHTNSQGCLQINNPTNTAPLPFITVAKSEVPGTPGTVVRIQISTNTSVHPSRIVGEYYTAPNNWGWPSRTTADIYGNVWVANRADGENFSENSDTADSPVQPDGSNIHGSITEFGVVIGGTRGKKINDLGGTNFTFVVDTNGEYLQPPFIYNTCIDRDGDGLIHTSPGIDGLGVERIYEWTNADDASYAVDEAIVRYVRTVATDVGTIAIDSWNNLWVGGIGNNWHEYIDTVTGIPVTGQKVNPSGGGLNGLFDPLGTVWSTHSSGTMYRFTPSGSVPQVSSAAQVPDPTNRYYAPGTDSAFGYGVGIDPANGSIWTAVNGNNGVYHYKPDGTSEYFSIPQSGGEAYSLKGIAVDAKGNVWAASGDGNYSGMYYVFHLLTNGQYVGSVPLILNTAQGVQPYGVSVDAQGMIWANCYGQDPSHPTDNPGLGFYAVRIDPNQGAVTNIGGTNFKVGQVVEIVDLNYCPNGGADDMGDLTGYRILNDPAHAGIWDFVQDSGIADRLWVSLNENSAIPAGSSIITEVRAANRVTDLPSWPFKKVSGTTLPTGIKGRYLEVRVTMLDNLPNTPGPTLTNLAVQWTGASVSGLQITNQPTSQMVYPGSNVTFSVQASIQSPATIIGYQWRSNDVAIADGGNVSGTASAMLTIADAQYTNAAAYSVRITDSTGTVLESAKARLHVMGNPPIISKQPRILAGPPYQPVTILTALAAVSPAFQTGDDNGYQPVYYQWLLYGQPIAGATGECTQTTNNIWQALLPTVSMACSNAPGYSVLFWNQYGEILSQSLGVDTGTNPVATIGSMTLTVNPTNGTGWVYHWYYQSSDNPTNFSIGASVNNYTVATDPTGNNSGTGTYTVIATNLAGSIAGAQWEVTSVDPNGPNVQVDDAQNATIDVTFIAAGAAIGPWSAQWYDNDVNPITGATNASYTIHSVGCPLGTTNSSPWGNYYISIMDACGNQSQSHGTLSISPVVVITNTVLTVVPLVGSGWNYQWYSNDVPLIGATSSSYLIWTDVNGNGPATYKAVVTNSAGGMAIGQLDLTGNDPSGPSLRSDPMQNATMNVTFNAVQTRGLGIGTWRYQWSGPNGIISGANNPSYTISSGACNVSGTYYVQISDGCSDSTSASPSFTAPSPQPVITNTTFTVHPTSGSGWTYKWYNSGSLITGATTASYSVAMDGSGGQIYSVIATNPAGGSATAQMEMINSSPTGPTAQVDSAQNLTIDATYAAAGLGTGSTFQWYDNTGNPVNGATAASYTIHSVGCPLGTQNSPWGSYTVYITDPCNNTYPVSGYLQMYPIVIITNTTFTLSPLSGSGWVYKWYYNGSLITGATSASYSVIADGFTTGTYHAVATNSLGGMAVGQAELTGNDPSGPVVQVDSGQNANMYVTFNSAQTQGNGIGTWQYQWNGPSGSINGANGPSYTITSTGCSASGQYQVSINDGCSDSASAYPQLATPASQETMTNTTFTVHPVSGTGWLYQWYNNGLAVGGATTASFSITMDGSANQIYSVIATNSSGGKATALLQMVSSSPSGPVAELDGASNMTIDVTFKADSAPGNFQWYDNTGNPVNGATGFSYTIHSLGCPLGTSSASPWGQYTVQTGGACGGNQSAVGTVQVVPIVIITNTTFTLNPTAGTGWNYTWFYNGTAINGANSASYSVAANNLNIGIYKVVATNASGGIALGQVELEGNSPSGPQIQADPTQNATMNVTFLAAQIQAAGIGGWAYQWSGPYGLINGATNAAYSLSPVNCTNVGGYSVQITDGCNDSASANPNINTGLSPDAAVSIASAVLTVHPIGGSGWLYQWYKNGSILNGATTSVYTVSMDSNPSGPGTGIYSVTATGSGGASAQAQFDVLNSYAQGPIVQVDDLYTINANVDVGFLGQTLGIGNWAKQWYYGYFAFGAAVAGGTNLLYTITNVVEGDAGYYTLQTSNNCHILDVQATLNVNNHNLRLTDPASQIVTVGSPVTFAVSASGATPFTYQWQFNGTNITGANAANYQIAAAAKTDAGNYRVIVSNPYSYVTSSVAVLTVVSVASLAPTNNPACVLLSSNATAQTWSIPVSTNPNSLELIATSDPNLPATNLPVGWLLNGVRTNITYVNLTQPALFTIVCQAGTSAITNYIAVTLNGDVEVGCSGNGPAVLGYWSFNNAGNPWIGNLGQGAVNAYGLRNLPSPWGRAVQIDTNIPANLSYNYGESNGLENVHCINGAVSLWFQPDWNSGIGPRSFARLIELGDIDSTNGWWALAIDFTGLALSFQSQSNGVLTTYFSQSITNWMAGNWYQLVLDYSPQQTSLYVNGVLIQTGPGITNYPTIANRAAYGFNLGSDHTGLNRVGGIIDEVTTYDCPLSSAQVAAGYPGGSTNVAPYFVTQPAGRVASPGSTVSFTVTAVGQLPLSYQWQKNSQSLNNGGNISGATSATLTLSNVSTNDAGNYSVIVGNNLGAVSSSTATLAIIGITITSPSSVGPFAVSNIDVIGMVTSSAPLQSVTVGGLSAFLNGSTFSARSIPLSPGTNQLTVVAQDINGYQNQTNITVIAATNQVNPLILIPSVTRGYAPLTVNFTVNASGLPGTLQSVTWDWEGDGVTDLTTTTLAGQSHAYGVGTFFPIVTATTSQGTFSSGGGINSDLESSPVAILVNITPTNVGTINITKPIGVKANADGSVYVLTAANPPAFALCNSNGSILRSMNLPAGSSGFDVDSNGIVYVAITTSNWVTKWMPDGGSGYTQDGSFSDVGFIGNPDTSSGTGSYQFNGPTGVAVSPEGTAIYVTDSLNARVQKFTTSGDILLTIGGFVRPTGITADAGSGKLFVADPGSSGVFPIYNDDPYGFFTLAGAMQASGDTLVLYTTDGTNVSQLDGSYTLIGQVPPSVGLNNPRSVSAWPSQTERRVYIADYGNNRVIAVSFPRVDPVGVWNLMKQAVANNNLPLAISYFSQWTSPKYKTEFQAVTLPQVSTILNQLPDLYLVSMTDSFAYYTVTATFNGTPITFYVNFSNENGTWKISSF